MKKMLRWGMAILVAALGCGVTAAQQPPKERPSVAEAARLARAQKANQPKAKRAWTNDNLPSAGGVSVLGDAPPTSAAPAGEEGAPSPEAAGGEAGAAQAQAEKDREAAEAELGQIQEQLAAAESELKLLSRDFDLMRQQFYSNPGYSGDRAGKSRLDALEGQVNAKQQEIESLRQKLSALQDKVKTHQASAPRKPGAPPSAEKERENWAAKVAPLREELARVEAEISRIRTESARAGQTIYGVTTGGSMASDMIQQLENRRRELQAQIAQIEDDARRAGVAPAAVR